MIQVNVIEQPIKVEFVRDEIDIVYNQDVHNISYHDEFELTASQIIGGQKVVCVRNGQAAIASNDEYECFNHVIGVTKGAVDAGQTAIIKPAGLLNGFSGLVPGAAYYMGLSGAITAEPPTSGIWQQIGIAKSETELIINISNPSWRL